MRRMGVREEEGEFQKSEREEELEQKRGTRRWLGGRSIRKII